MLNKAALARHQGIRKCQLAVSQPLHPSPLAAVFNLQPPATPSPSPSPISSPSPPTSLPSLARENLEFPSGVSAPGSTVTRSQLTISEILNPDATQGQIQFPEPSGILRSPAESQSDRIEAPASAIGTSPSPETLASNLENRSSSTEVTFESIFTSRPSSQSPRSATEDLEIQNSPRPAQSVSSVSPSSTTNPSLADTSSYGNYWDNFLEANSPPHTSGADEFQENSFGITSPPVIPTTADDNESNFEHAGPARKKRRVHFSVSPTPPLDLQEREGSVRREATPCPFGFAEPPQSESDTENGIDFLENNTAPVNPDDLNTFLDGLLPPTPAVDEIDQTNFTKNGKVPPKNHNARINLENQRDEEMDEFVASLDTLFPINSTRGWGPTLPDTPPDSQMVVEVVLENPPVEELPGPLLLFPPERGADLVAPPNLTPLQPVAPGEFISGMESHMDIDSCCVTVHPSQLSRIFGRKGFTRLISYSPDFKDLAFYKDWVFVAQAEAVLLIHPIYKEELIRKLRAHPQRSKIYANPHAKTFCMGSPILMMSVLVRAMEDAGIQSVRVGVYGMKAPLTLFHDPAGQVPHALQETNVYDIGRTYAVSSIIGVKPKQAKSPYNAYPSALRVGKGFGGVDFKNNRRQDGINHFKAYPVLTHVLKAVAQGAGQAAEPKIVRTCQARVQTLTAWRDRLAKCPESDMCGLRLEVSIRAPSLQAAKYAAVQSRLLDAEFLFSDEAAEYQLASHTFRKADLLADVEELLEIAEKLKIFRGNSAKASSAIQRQVLIDLFNALGWHPGRRPTALDANYPWWDSLESSLEVAAKLEEFTGKEKTRLLFGFVQVRLPCANQACSKVGRYALTGRDDNFRIKCGDCSKCLSSKLFRQHLAHVIVSGNSQIELGALVVDTSTLDLISPNEDNRLVKLSKRPELATLMRTKAFQKTRNPLLLCLGSVLEADTWDEDERINKIYTFAIEWLQENIEIVHRHINNNTEDAVRLQLNRLFADDRALAEDVLFLQGVAGAYKTNIAHLVVTNASGHTCQVIPLGARGPFLGLVKLHKGGYEVLAQAAAA